ERTPASSGRCRTSDRPSPGILDNSCRVASTESIYASATSGAALSRYQSTGLRKSAQKKSARWMVRLIREPAGVGHGDAIGRNAVRLGADASHVQPGEADRPILENRVQQDHLSLERCATHPALLRLDRR